MSTFVVSDIHGNVAALWALLNQEGLVGDTEELTELGETTTIVSIGDLLNAVLEDVTGDEMCAHVAPKWFDHLIVGNHEWPYLHDTATFSGYYGHPPLRSQYNAWRRSGFVVPALLVGETLLSHAGWAFTGDWTAEEAYLAIEKAWQEYPNWRNYVLDAIGWARGGRAEVGGILWSDFRSEKKNKRFSQVVGHTPMPEGPVLYERQDGTFTLNIDTGCKGGGRPSGVWLDDDGRIEKIISLEV